jgi:predicted transglutaminase-like cysteine proteinase
MLDSRYSAGLWPKIPRHLVVIWFVGLMSTSLFALELSRTLLDYIDSRFGSSATQRLIDWQTLANSNLDRQAIEKLNDVNAFFNQATFISDQKHWGSEDYWATPVELLATNGGDCEDYSIAKYFTLKEMGIPEEKLKITYVKALKLNQAHMVLAYYEQPDSEPLILDNLIAEIKPSSQRDDLLPVYSFNGEGLWLSRFKGNKQKRIGGPERLDNWLDMMTRQNKLIK